MRVVHAILLALSVACGATAPPGDERATVDDLDVEQPVRRDGPAERERALPPDRRLDDTPHARDTPRRRFRGRRIDFDVKDADLHNVFRLLADVGNVNIVVGDDVSGSLTLRVRQLPWDQVLDVVVRAKGLYMKVDRDVIMILGTGPEP